MSYTEVIIRGHVFDCAEKAPFVVSGKSVLGAMEYDPENSTVKCHECGEGFQCISYTHLRDKHRITVEQYKARHGLNARSGLCTPEFSAMRRMNSGCAGSPERTAVLIAAGREYKRVHGNNNSNRRVQSERANGFGRCQAQALFRLQLLAAELGRTPTTRELYAKGLNDPLLVRHFGSVAKAMDLAGLNRRSTGRPRCPTDCSLPSGFPTKKRLLETRMPWPKDYFTVGSDQNYYGPPVSPQSSLSGEVFRVSPARHAARARAE